MSVTLEGKLVVALSSRALFDFEEENRVFENQDASAYMAVQLERMERPAKSGVAFPLVKKLLTFNADGQHRVEVVILSRNDPVSGLRVFRSAKEEGLALERGVFTRGRPPYHYLSPLGAHLSPHKSNEEMPSAVHRQEMVRLAIKDNPHFILSDIELRRGGRSFTIDTILELLRMNAETDLYFITGLDSFLEIGTWKVWERLLTLCFLRGAFKGRLPFPGCREARVPERSGA